MNEFERGTLLGFFIGEASFGGDGQTPHIIFRADISRQALIVKLTTMVPGSEVYGPYDNRGKKYLQWMVRGAALKQLVESELLEGLKEWDPTAHARYRAMVDRYSFAGSLRVRSMKRRRMTSSKGISSTETDSTGS